MLPPDRPMSNQCPIIYFGNDWHAENRTSSHHIARCLAERGPMLYIDAPTRAPRASGRDFRKIGRLLRRMFTPPRQISAQMWHATVPQLPFRRWRMVRWLNRRMGIWLVKKALRKLRFHHPVLWFAAPPLAPVAGHLGERFVVYYCIDDYAALPHMDHHEVTRLDDELTRAADQVFTSSRPLLEKKKKINPTALYSPHGVDADRFGHALDPDFPVAAPLAGLRHPVIGFYGSISGWIDIELMTFLAKARPQWTFVMIGLISVDVGELAHLPNLVFIGPQPYDNLPHWVKAFDVGLQPYILNSQTYHSNPLKLREYLAAGKPVVSISIPEVDLFAGHVGTATNYDEFLQRIEEALATDSAERQKARQALVADMSWERRVAEAWSVVQEGLERRTGGRQTAASIA